MLRSAGREVPISGPETRSYAVDSNTSRAAFSVLEGMGERLFLLEPSGRVSRVYDSPLPIGGLTWGPGEASLTYVEQPNDGVARVRILHLGSGEVRTIAVLGVPHLAAEPSWSGDGRWLAIEAQPTQQLRGMTVYIHDHLDGSLTLVDPLEEPEPKSACPRFAPNRPILAYTWTDAGVLDSQVRLYSPETGRRDVIEMLGLNDPRWARDGMALLAVSHRSICDTDLVRLDPLSLTVETLLRATGHLTPILLDAEDALFVQRRCNGAEEIPTDAGELQVLRLASGQVEVIASAVYSAWPV